MTGYFTRTYEVWRTTQVPDGYGGFIETTAKVADLEGRAYPGRATDEVIAAQRTGVIVWTFAAAGDADVREGDEIRFDGRVLKVRAVAVTSSGRRLEAMCEEGEP
jgi:head-tail adaptor